MAVAGIFVVVESWLLIGDNPKERAKRLAGFYMTSLLWWHNISQLAIGAIGTQGAIPFIAVLALLLIAVLPPLFFKQGQPQCHEHKSLSYLNRLAG